MVSSVSVADQITNIHYHHNPALLINNNNTMMYPTVIIKRDYENSSSNDDLILSSNTFEFHNNNNNHSKSEYCHRDDIIIDDTMMMIKNIDHYDHHHTMNMMTQHNRHPINPYDIVSTSSSMSSSLSSSSDHNVVVNNNHNNDIMTIISESESKSILQHQKPLSLLPTTRSSILLFTSTITTGNETKQLIQLLDSSCITYDIHIVSSTDYQSLLLGNEATLPGILLLYNHHRHVWIPHNDSTLLEKAREHIFTNQVVVVDVKKEPLSLLSSAVLTTMSHHHDLRHIIPSSPAEYHLTIIPSKEYNQNNVNNNNNNNYSKHGMKDSTTTNTTSSSFITATTHRDSYYNITISSSNSSITSNDHDTFAFTTDVMKQQEEPVHNDGDGDSIKDNDNDLMDHDDDDDESLTLSTIFRMAAETTSATTPGTTPAITTMTATTTISNSRSCSINHRDESQQNQVMMNSNNDHNNEGNVINNDINCIALPNCSNSNHTTMTIYDMIRYLLKHMKHHCSKSLPNHHHKCYHTGSSHHDDDDDNDNRDYGYYYITGSEAITIWSKLYNDENHNNGSISNSISYNDNSSSSHDDDENDDIVQRKKKQQEQEQHFAHNIIDFGYELIQKGVLYCYNPNQYCTYHNNNNNVDQDTNSTIYDKYQQFRSLYLVIQPLYQPYILNELIHYKVKDDTNGDDNDCCSDDNDLTIPNNYDDALLLLSKQKNHNTKLPKEQPTNLDIIDNIISLSSMMDHICSNISTGTTNNDNSSTFDYHHHEPNENTGLHTTKLYETFEIQVCQLQHMTSIPTFLLPYYFRISHPNDGNNKKDHDDDPNQEVRIKFLLNLFNLMIRHAMILASDEYRNIPTIRSSTSYPSVSDPLSASPSNTTNNTNKMMNDVVVERTCYYLYEWPNQLHDIIPFFQRIKYLIGGHIISLYDIQCELFGLHHSSTSLSLFEIDHEESLLLSPDNDGNSGDRNKNCSNKKKNNNNKATKTVTSSKTATTMSDDTYPKKDNETSTNTLKKKIKRWNVWNLITSCGRSHHYINDSVILDTFTSSGSGMVHHHNKLTDHNDVSNGDRSHDGTSSSNFNNSNREYIINDNQEHKHQTVPISLSSQQNQQYYNSLGYRIISNTNNIPYYRHNILQNSYDKRIIMAMTWCTKDSPSSIRTIYQHEKLHDVLNEYCITYCQNHLQIHQTNEIILLPTYFSYFRESFIYVPPIDSSNDIKNNDNHNKTNHESINHLAYFHHANIQPVDGTYQFIQPYISSEQQKQINDLLYENGYLDILFHHEYNWKRGLSYNHMNTTSSQDVVLTSLFPSNHHKLSYRDFAESQTNVIDNCTLYKKKNKDFEHHDQHTNLIVIDEKQIEEEHQHNTTSSQHSTCHRHNMMTMNKNTRSSRKNYVRSDIETNGIGTSSTNSSSISHHMMTGTGRSKRRVLKNSYHDDDMKKGNISRRRLLLRRGSSGGGLSYQSNSYISLTPPSLHMTMTNTRQTSMGETQLLLLPSRNNQNHHYGDNNDCKYDDYFTSNDYDYDCDFTVTDLSVFTS